MVDTDGTYLTLDLKSWVFGTISKVEDGTDWNVAWQETYRELGGKSPESGKKACPMTGTRTLYELGRIRGAGRPYKHVSFQEVLDGYSKNGVYALLAIEHLAREPSISLTELWPDIQNHMRTDLGVEPANSNQGGPTVAFKLWHLGLIAHS